ncbi:translocation and assembly module TamB [Tamilnaduibacter salinus]|uniref:Translocation and assembly module TamB n=1 Tax=Tamilnaduibacter salinus TaxID=1484056 RepID=A0A2A2I0Y7_9GAMM|nr:translocation/assembly module TamB domain-containing protein [Tamilnaduibacter salinus]PAV25691.1 hypothetical protein CF392_09605 [Tamilnaduibacter salinus]PVY79233.1 translocation and assembly module TamB [Tamilnaduibacter salinus]
MRLVLKGLIALLLALMVGIAALVLTLRSDAGTRWVLEQIPGLTITAGEGTLLGRWQAEVLAWHGFGVRAHVETPLLDWSPSCLFTAELCVEELSLSRADVRVDNGQSSSDTAPLTPPNIELPIAVTIRQVDLGPVSVNDTVLWDQLRLIASAGGSQMHVSSLNARRGHLTVDGALRVTTRSDWPVDGDLSIELPEPDGTEDWRLNVTVAGSVRDLRLEGTSRGYLSAAFSGELAPLEPTLPVRLSLSEARLQALPSLPDTLTLTQGSANLEGNLESGYNTRAALVLPSTTGDMPARVTGTLMTTGVRGMSLRLQTDQPDREARVTGSLNWAEGFMAQGELAMGRFPWFGLLPDIGAPPVTVTSLHGPFEYKGGGYQAELTGRAESPAGPLGFELNGAGDDQQVTLSTLSLTARDGTLSGQGQIGFADTLSWQGDLRLSAFNPAFWRPSLSSELSGRVHTEGQMAATGPKGTARWQLEGQWRQNPATLNGELAVSNGLIRVPSLEARIGDNRLTGSGEWQTQLQAEFDGQLRALNQIWPGLEGQFRASGRLGGTLTEPGGDVSFQGEALSWQDRHLGSLSGQARAEAGRDVAITVEAREIRAAGQVVDRVRARLTGDPDRHRLVVTLERPDMRSRVTLAGGVEGRGWQGQMASGRVSVAEQDWRLASPAALRYREDGTLTLGAHCWRWENSSLCAGSQQLLPSPVLNYALNRFPARALAPWLPEAVRWRTTINGDMALDLSGAGPNGRLSLNAGPGDIGLLHEGDWQRVDYDRLSADVLLRPEAADVDLRLAGSDLGELSVHFSVAPNEPGRPVDGRYRVKALNMAPLGPLVGLTEASGRVNGAGQLSGPLMNPVVGGALHLSDGQVAHPQLPIPIEDLFVSLRFKGRQADLSGRWSSSERSEARLDGEVDWRDEQSRLRLTLTGDRLPFQYEPWARVELSPDLTLRLVGRQLSVSGRVDVPRGSITVRQLPEQAVSVSDDEVIEGREQASSSLTGVSMDVTVNVGSDRVDFNGFDVIGLLEGQIQIGDNLDANGTLSLVDGHYEAYGQDLTLRRARLVFVGSLTRPYVDIEAIRTVDTVVAGLRLSGPVTQPTTTIFSEPPMSQSEALAYLILGRPLNSRGDQTRVSQAALSLGLAQTAGVTRNIGEKVGIEDLTLETEGKGDEASVVASGRITDDLSVRYGMRMFEPVTVMALRYDLGEYFYLEAASGIAASLDLFYTRDF